MWYSGAGGKMINEKKQKQKISWHCPFKCPEAWYAGKILVDGKIRGKLFRNNWGHVDGQSTVDVYIINLFYCLFQYM
jgi:hypothetical protein